MKRLLTALAFVTAASTAQAAVLIQANNVGDDLVFSYSGTLDLTGMVQDGQDLSPRSLIAGGVGAILSYNNNVDRYALNSLPAFGNQSLSNGVTLGTDFAIFSNDFLGIQAGYQSGDAIDGTLTFANESIATAGLFFGSFTTTLDSGDTITMRISDANVVPLPAGLPLLLAGLAGFGVLARRKRG